MRRLSGDAFFSGVARLIHEPPVLSRGVAQCRDLDLRENREGFFQKNHMEVRANEALQ